MDFFRWRWRWGGRRGRTTTSLQSTFRGWVLRLFSRLIKIFRHFLILCKNLEIIETIKQYWNNITSTIIPVRKYEKNRFLNDNYKYAFWIILSRIPWRICRCFFLLSFLGGKQVFMHAFCNNALRRVIV